MLQTLRAFGFEQLERSGERDEIGQRHAAWCLDMVEQAEPQMRGPHQVHWLSRLDREHDNLRAALGWTLDSGQFESALLLAGGLWRYWSTRGYFLEGQTWLDRALDASHDQSISSAAHARALTAAGEMAWGRGDFAHARSCHEASLVLRRSLEDRPGVAQALQYLANLAMERGEADTAWALHEEALAQRRELGVTRDIAVSLQNLGRLAATRDDLEVATRLLEEALELSRAAKDELGQAAALRELGEVALREQQVDRAADLLAESLRVARVVGARWTIARGLECLALVAGARRQLAIAVRLLGSADALREQLRSPQLPTERASVEGTLKEARARLGEGAFSAMWALGRATPVEIAVSLLDAPVDTSPTAGAAVLSPRELEARPRPVRRATRFAQSVVPDAGAQPRDRRPARAARACRRTAPHRRVATGRRRSRRDRAPAPGPGLGRRGAPATTW
jgi:non-specific serine/threonine protein kinase